MAVADNSGSTTDVAYTVTVTPKAVVKKTTTAAAFSSGSKNSYAAPSQGCTDTSVAATDTTGGLSSAALTTDGSSNASSGAGNLDFDFDSFESSMKDLFDNGMEHYGEGVAWDGGMTSDGTVFWGQDW